MPRLMAGQFCFCGDVARGVDAGVGEDAGCGLLRSVGGVLGYRQKSVYGPGVSGPVPAAPTVLDPVAVFPA
ncbi:hypothetical protein E4A49_09220, partial [Micrococcus lylae]